MLALLRSAQRASPAATAMSRVALFSTATEPLVLVEKVDSYAVVRLNRAPVNSLSLAVRACV